MRFDHIRRILWGSGDGKYGDAHAKEKAVELMEQEKKVFVPEGICREYEERYGRKLLKEPSPYPHETTLYQYGFIAVAIPSADAVQILRDYKPDPFESFMLRDCNAMHDVDTLRMRNVTSEHLLLDFSGSVYAKGAGTDHCFD